MRSAITFLTMITFLYTLFFVLLVSSGLSAWTTLTPSVVNLYGSMAIFCPLSGIVCAFSRYSKRTLKQFNVVPLVRFYWFYNYVLPIYLFLALVSFDYEATISIWNLKLWDTGSYLWVRGLFCEYGTSKTTCNVPESTWAQGIAAVDAFCLSSFGNKDCYGMQSSAQNRFKIYSIFSFIFIAVVCTVTSVLMIVLIVSVRAWIGAELISNTTLNHTEAVFWFLIPTIGAALTGTFFLTNIGTTLTSFLLLSITFFCSSFVYLVVSLLALLITHYSPTTSGQVKTKLGLILSFIIIGIISTIAALVTVTFGSIYWATENQLDTATATSLTCNFDYSNSCSNCPVSCPEWTYDEVEQVLRSAFKVAVLLGALLCLFGVTTILTGVRWYNYYRHHRVDYV